MPPVVRETTTGRLDSLSRSVSVLGVPVTPFESYEDAVDCIDECLQQGRRLRCFAVNPEKIQRAVRDPELLRALREAEICICDGVGVALAARMLLGRFIRRCTGIDLFYRLIQASVERSWSVYLLGGRPDVNREAVARLRAQYPGITVVGHRDGYFGDDDVAEEIARVRPDLLFVGLGSPRQEHWISRNFDRLEAGFCMGIGGTLDVVSQRVRRAPVLFRRTSTEFLYRLMTNPGRLRRQVSLPVFAGRTLRAWAGRRVGFGVSK